MSDRFFSISKHKVEDHEAWERSAGRDRKLWKKRKRKKKQTYSKITKNKRSYKKLNMKINLKILRFKSQLKIKKYFKNHLNICLYVSILSHSLSIYLTDLIRVIWVIWFLWMSQSRSVCILPVDQDSADWLAPSLDLGVLLWHRWTLHNSHLALMSRWTR